jgi:hypothetical protein
MYGDPHREDGIQDSWIPSWLDYFFFFFVVATGQPVVGPVYTGAPVLDLL